MSPFRNAQGYGFKLRARAQLDAGLPAVGNGIAAIATETALGDANADRCLASFVFVDVD
jgi:hypothetical protein